MPSNGASHTYYRGYNILLLKFQILFSDDLESHPSHFLSDNLEYSRKSQQHNFLLNLLLIYVFITERKKEAKAINYVKSSGFWYTEINPNPSILRLTELSFNVWQQEIIILIPLYSQNINSAGKDLFIFLSNLFCSDQGLLRSREKVYMPFIIQFNKKAISLP